MDWYLKAANNGNTDAIYKIGDMYRWGYGVTKNIRTAIEWYTKAANQGNAQAQYKLGYVYQNEDQVKDLQRAVNWYQKAVDNGSENAKYRLKELNKQGYYAEENEQEGILITVILFFDLLKDN
jgi:TPR repeat protein